MSDQDDLDILHLAEVDELLTKHKFDEKKHEKLGLHLGLSPNTIDVITANKGDNTRYLMEGLKAWLKKYDNVKHPTIPNLICALRKIGEDDTAEGICREKHPACCILKQYTQDQSVVQALPQLALFLNKEHIAGESIVLTDGSDEKLLLAIRDSVCADKRNLDKFATVLQKLPSTAETGIFIKREYSKRVLMNSSGAEMSSEEHDKTRDLKISSVDEFTAMRNYFASMVTSACKAMKEIPSNELKDYLCRGYFYLAPQLGHNPTTDLMLDLVCGRCSIINVSLLEGVARHFRNEAAIALIEQYKKNVQESKPLRAFLEKKLSSGSLLKCETIRFIVDKSVDDYTLEDVRLLLSQIFKDLAPHVTIDVVRSHHSFTVTCSFPLALSEQLIATADENIELLKEKGVTELIIGYCTVHDADKVNIVDKGVEMDKTQQYERSKLEQLLLSQNMELLIREQELTHLKEEEEQKRLVEKDESDKMTQELKTKMETLLSKGQSVDDYNGLKKQIEKLVKKNEELSQELSKLQKQAQRPLNKENPILFEDDIYGDIIIDHPLILKFVKTRQFQRLKDIKQLGYTYRSMPKATYSRLQHSIGMYYLAGKYAKQLQRQIELKEGIPKVTDCDVLCIQIAALCYNLGFGPFPYIFEMFLDEAAKINQVEKPWKHVSQASVKMFDCIIEQNADLKCLLEYFLDDFEEDITFIKELIKGEKNGQRKNKTFLYEVVVNRTSGLDVCMLDYTARDAAVVGMTVNFKWRVFLSKVRVVKCSDDQYHICVRKDDLDTYNDLFSTRHSIYREVYYQRKSRLVATMIKRILIRSNNSKLVRDGNRMVTIFEATKNSLAYTQLNDGILHVIRSIVDDPEVQVLLDCLESLKYIAQIGFISSEEKNLKERIIEATDNHDIADYLIIDRIRTGYEKYDSLEQYYYCNNGSTGKWEEKWAKPSENAINPPSRIFLISGNKKLVEEVQNALRKIMKEDSIKGEIYPADDNADLMPDFPTTGASLFSQV